MPTTGISGSTCSTSFRIPIPRRTPGSGFDSRAPEPETHFAIAVAGGAAGGIGLELGAGSYRQEGTLGYWLGRPYWGRGPATEAVRRFTAWAFDAFDICRVSATVFEWNPASMRVLEKAGFACEGRLRRSLVKDGRVIDRLIYARIKGEPG